jgi:hypothetical protein
MKRCNEQFAVPRSVPGKQSAISLALRRFVIAGLWFGMAGSSSELSNEVIVTCQS